MTPSFSVSMATAPKENVADRKKNSQNLPQNHLDHSLETLDRSRPTAESTKRRVVAPQEISSAQKKGSSSKQKKER